MSYPHRRNLRCFLDDPQVIQEESRPYITRDHYYSSYRINERNHMNPIHQKSLRSGYTTGTCASAAAKAAANFLLTGKEPDSVNQKLPEGEEGIWYPKPCTDPGYEGFFQVQKDAGDDPDVTDRSWICARVSPISRPRLTELKDSGRGYWLEDYPDLYINGGTGIGIATKPGLSCPPGHYAINPVPRSMIAAAVWQTCQQAAYEGCLEVQVAIPEGQRLAEKTFNPRLGIEGGISVLGTTGIVKPMSEEALLETIRLDIHMKGTAGEKILLLAPGNYGENFLRENMGVPLGEAVLCSNFVGDAVAMLVKEQIRQVLFVGHIGKLVKVSAGVRNTHSRYGDGRMEQMAELLQTAAPENAALRQAVLQCNTTEEAVSLLREAGSAEQTLNLLAARVKAQLEEWSGGQLKAQVVTFSSAYGILGKTSQADELLTQWKRQKQQKQHREDAN